MSRSDIPVFIGRWHDAMRGQCTHTTERADLDGWESQLKKAFGGHGTCASWPVTRCSAPCCAPAGGHCCLHGDLARTVPRLRHAVSPSPARPPRSPCGLPRKPW